MEEASEAQDTGAVAALACWLHPPHLQPLGAQ